MDKYEIWSLVMGILIIFCEGYKEDTGNLYTMICFVISRISGIALIIIPMILEFMNKK